MSYRYDDLYSSRNKLEGAYETFTRGRRVSNIIVHAERDIFTVLVDSLQCMETFKKELAVLGVPQEPKVPNFAYKTAHVFLVERPGWGLKFMGNIEAEF